LYLTQLCVVCARDTLLYMSKGVNTQTNQHPTQPY